MRTPGGAGQCSGWRSHRHSVDGFDSQLNLAHLGAQGLGVEPNAAPHHCCATPLQTTP